MKFFKWLAVLIPIFCFGQKTDLQLATQKTNTIIGKPYSPTNTASLDQAIFDSKLSRLEVNGTSGTNTYTVSITWVSAYTNGLWVQVYFNAASTGASTINISSLGAKSIKNIDGSSIASGDIKIGPYLLYYDGTNFIKTTGGTPTSSISGLTTNYLPLATSSTTLGNSEITKSSTGYYFINTSVNGNAIFSVDNTSTLSNASSYLTAQAGTSEVDLISYGQNTSTPGLAELKNNSGDLKITVSGGNINAANANLKLQTAGNKLFITEGSNGSVGQTTLVSGTKAITITGTTTSSRCFLQLVSQGGTVTTTADYGCVCTSNTVTITALTNAGATVTLDTSTLNYWIVN